MFDKAIPRSLLFFAVHLAAPACFRTAARVHEHTDASEHERHKPFGLLHVGFIFGAKEANAFALVRLSRGK